MHLFFFLFSLQFHESPTMTVLKMFQTEVERTLCESIALWSEPYHPRSKLSNWGGAHAAQGLKIQTRRHGFSEIWNTKNKKQPVLQTNIYTLKIFWCIFTGLAYTFLIWYI